MKVSSSIRSLYNQQVELNKRLQRKVNEIFSDGNNGRWFYKGRVKELESFTQKIETGRFNPDILEDFFACSLVVENRSAISEARELVEKYCEIISQKPADPKFTFKKPDSFAFDDLRMYVKLKKSDRIPPNDLNDITFEIQIKTFLQYAWGIATHDLIYKGDTISWSKARLAFQIKAMLEHAEISIEQVELVAASSSLDMSNKETEALLDILKWLNEQWALEELPHDIIRLCQTILDCIKCCKISLEHLKSALSKDNEIGMGINLKNLSPYEIIIKSIAQNHFNELKTYLNGSSFFKTKILITPEMEIKEIFRDVKKDKLLFI